MLRVGIMGSRIDTHAAWLDEIPGVELLNRTAFGADASALASPLFDEDVPDRIRELISASDLVVVSASERMQAGLVSAVVGAHRAVMSDVPVAGEVEVVSNLVRDVRSLGIRHFTPFRWRWHPAVLEAREVILAEQFGSLDLLEVMMTGLPGIHPSPESTARSLIELGLHSADTLRWISGREWTPVSAWTDQQPIPGRVTAHRIATLEAASTHRSARCRILTSVVREGRPRLHLRALGRRGELTVELNTDDGTGSWRLSCGGRAHGKVFPETSVNPYFDIVADLLTGTRWAPDFTDALAAHHLTPSLTKLEHQHVPPS